MARHRLSLSWHSRRLSADWLSWEALTYSSGSVPSWLCISLLTFLFSLFSFFTFHFSLFDLSLFRFFAFSLFRFFAFSLFRFFAFRFSRPGGSRREVAAVGWAAVSLIAFHLYISPDLHRRRSCDYVTHVRSTRRSWWRPGAQLALVATVGMAGVGGDYQCPWGHGTVKTVVGVS
jgi:hypothetical protein